MVHIRNRVVVPIDSLEWVGKPHRIAVSEACQAYIQGCSDLYQGVGCWITIHTSCPNCLPINCASNSCICVISL